MDTVTNGHQKCGSPTEDIPTVLKKIANEAKKNLLTEFKTPSLDLFKGTDSKMKVFLRVRPFTASELSTEDNKCCVVIQDLHTIDMRAPKDSATFKNSKVTEAHRFHFTQVYDQHTDQTNIFESTTMPYIEKVINGKNSLIFCYGVTNSGKTYTVQGTTDNPGIIPRTMDILFNSFSGRLCEENIKYKPRNFSEVLLLTKEQVSQELKLRNTLLKQYKECLNDFSVAGSSNDGSIDRTFVDPATRLFTDLDNRLREVKTVAVSNPDLNYSIWISFAQIYNENIYDLFESGNNEGLKKLRLAEDAKGNIYVKELVEVNVQSADEACKFLFVGQKNLKTAATKLNHYSSRSHCIFNIRIVGHNNQGACLNTLSFCDLAGSERSTKAQNKGLRLKEASKINTSLMVLGRCLDSLRHNQCHKDKVIVPFRDSKLTRMFQIFFTGKGEACMIVNISPSPGLFDETMHALRFSALAKEVICLQTKPRPAPTKLSLALNDVPDPRLTIAWADGKSSICLSEKASSSSSDDEEISETDESVATDEGDEVANLKDIIGNLKHGLREVIGEKMTLEAQLRKQFAEDLREHLARADIVHGQKLQSVRTHYEELMDSRLELMESALQSSKKRLKTEQNGNAELLNEMQPKIEKCEAENHEYREQIVKLQFKCAVLESDQAKSSGVKCSNEESQDDETLQAQLAAKDQEISSLNEKVMNLENSASSKDGEIDELNKNAFDSLQKIQDMKDMIVFLQDELDSMRTEAEQSIIASSEVEALMPSNSETSILMQKLDSISGGLFDLNKKAQCGLEKAKTTLPSRASLAHFSAADIADKDRIIKEMKSKLEHAEDQRRSYWEASETLGGKCKELESQKSKLEDDLEKANSVVKNLTGQRECLESQLENKGFDVDEKQAQIETLQMENSHLRGEKESRAENFVEKDLYVVLKSEFQTTTNDLESAKLQLRDVTESNAELKKELISADATTKSTIQKNHDLEKEIEQLQICRDSYSNLQQENFKLHEEVEGLESQINELREVQKSNEDSISSLNENRVELQKQNESLATEMDSLKEQIKQADKDAKENASELSILVESKDKLQKEIVDLNSKIEGIRVKVLDLLFSTDNKERAMCDHQGIDDILYSVKRSVIELSNRYVDFLEDSKRRQELEKSVLSLQNMLANCETDLRSKNEHVKLLSSQLNTQSDHVFHRDNTITDLKEKLRIEKSKCEQLSKHLSAKNSEVEYLLSKCNDKDAKNEEENAKVSDFSDDLSSTTSNEQQPQTTTKNLRSCRKKNKVQSYAGTDDCDENADPEIQAATKSGRSCRKKRLQSYAAMDDSEENNHPEFQETTTKKRGRPRAATPKDPASAVLVPFNPHEANKITKTGNSNKKLQKKGRKRLFKNDISEPFLCTPPIISVNVKQQESPHTIVKRKLRNRK